MHGREFLVSTVKFKMANKRSIGDKQQSSAKKKLKTAKGNDRSRIKQVEDEADFPRGGASALSPLEVRRIKQEAEKDVLFGTPTEEEPKKKKKSKTKGKQLDEKISPVELESSPQVKLVENLSFKRLAVGMKLLGAVKEISEYEIVISLPNGLSGFVNVLDINDKMTELLTSQDENINEDDNDDDIPSLENLFTLNSLVVCVIKEIFPEKHGHKKIKLSVKPEDINNGVVNLVKGMVVNGYVSSEEDHGYIVSFGIDGKTGFLPKKPKPPVDIILGKPLQVFVKSGDEARVAAVRVDNDKINMAMVTEEMNFKLSSLLPGMMVQMTVKECTSNGLVVSFLEMFEGTVSLNHLPENGGDGQDLEKKYKKKSKIIGRILYINAKQKIVVLSAHQAIVEYKPVSFGDLAFGHIIEEATVLRVDQGFGMLLKIDDDTLGYSHISHVSDSHLEKLDKRYKPGSQHKCRVVGFNAVDGLVSLSLKKSVLERPFLRYHDIEVGSVIECTILSLEKFGMLVSVAHNIKGLVTNMHLADIILKHPEKKLKEGKKIDCRVLTVLPEKRRLHLTYKKTLVSSEHPIITKYTDAKVGMVTHGFITSLRENSCIVTFYNNVTGLIPRGELGIQPQEDPRQVFYVGQVVKCYIMNCQPEERKMRLTLKASSIVSPTTSSQGSIQPGAMVDVDVVASTNEGLDVQVSPSGLPALLPVSHLSDHPCNCQALLAIYKPSSQPVRLTDVLYFGQGNNKTHIVSLKPSLKNAVQQGKVLTSFDDIHVGMVLSGYIKQIMSYGIFIEFAPRIFGLAPNSFLANQFVADASDHFEVGQSVIAKVVETNEERKRFLVSLKQSDLMPDSISWDQSIAGDLVLDYLKEKKLILDSTATNSDNAKELLSCSQGHCVEAKVKSIKKHGIMLQLAGGLKGFVPHQLAEGVSCQEGEVVYGVVLDHDIDAMTVEVTLLPDIVKEVRKEKTEKTKKKKMKPGQFVDCVVLLIKQNYIVVCLPQHQYRLAIAPAKMHLNDIRDASKRYAVRQKYTATVHSGQPLVVVLEDKSTSKENIKPGIITSAVVKSVKAIQMNVHLENCGLSGRVNICHVTDEIKEGKSPFKEYHQGEKIQVKVLGFRDTKTHNFLPVTHKNFSRSVAELSIKQSDLNNTETSTQYKPPELEDYKIGDKITAFVKSVTDHCIWMIVSDKVTGRVSLLHASLDVKVLRKLSSHFKQGTAYTCYVMSIDTTHETLELSIAYKPEDTLSKGSIVAGRVSKASPVAGLNIQLPLHKCGRASLTDILDQYTSSPVENFKERQIVKCYVLGARDDGHLDLSLRPSRTKGETTKDEAVEDSKVLDPEYESLTDLDVGGLVKGFVQSVSNAGVFVSLSRQIRARVQIKNLSHFFVKDWRPLFPVGKLVTGKILSIDPSNGRVELSLKGKDTGLEDPAPNPKKVEKEKAKKRKREAASKELKTVDGDKDDKEGEERDDSDEEIMLKKLKGESDSEDDESDPESDESSDEESSEEEADKASSAIKSSSLPRLHVSSGFDWNASTEENGDVVETDDESSDSETEATEQVARKKSKRQKRAEKKAEEEFLYKTEQALLDQDRAPESTDDFDRLVLTSPNNSVLWLQYMAFHLHITEIDKARAVAERAVKTISFREEREKLNIWVAMMNLENLYGTQDSLVKVFERALQHNDPKKVFFHLITIYSKSDKNELAEQLFHTMTKRFSQSKKVWIEFGRFHMKSGKVESARKILQRALKSLVARKHVDTIVQFALMEFKLGDPQRGQTVMEEVLSNYPKRSDLWSVYIDMMIKLGDPDVVRNIFERVIHLNLSSKKMKFLFKRYLLFEREHGDDLSVEKVKTKAMEYVESKVALS